MESIGYTIQKDIQTEQTTQLRECAVAITLQENYSRGGIAAQAIAGLEDLLFRIKAQIDQG